MQARTDKGRRRRRCISAPPERELERKLKLNPDDPDAKADVGSDESMDASDPPAAAQPGQCDEPVPSSGFPMTISGKVTAASQKSRAVANNQQSTVFPMHGRISSLDAVTPL